MDAGLLDRSPWCPDVPLGELDDPVRRPTTRGSASMRTWQPPRDPDLVALEALDRLARAEATSFADPRHVDAAGSCTHPAVVPHVHVPVATALGLSQEPGTLEGYGPISAHHVRSLLPSAALRLVLVDEATGEPLYLDPELHRPAPASPAHSGLPPAPARRSGPAASPGAMARQRVRDLVPAGPVLVVDEPEG